MASPTSRTLGLLRNLGYEAWIVEQTIRAGKMTFKRDVGNIGDILAWRMVYDELPPTLLVQACVTGDVQKRMAKAELSPSLRTWLATGDRCFWVVGWKEYAKVVDRKHWRPTIYSASLFDGRVVWSMLNNYMS